MTPEPNTPQPNTPLRDALHDACPAPPLPESLTARVAALAAVSDAARAPRLAHRRRTRLRLLGAGATAVLILMLLLMPRLNAVIALARMADSLKDVKSVHSVTWQIMPDGKHVKSREQWYQAGSWRVENAEGHSVQICAGGKRWVYSADENKVTMERASLPIGYQGITGFSLAAGTRDAVAMGVLMDVRVLDAATINGRAAHWVQVSDNKYPDARSKIAVDDATGLPLRGEVEEYAGGHWVVKFVGTSQYNLPIAQSVFAPSFPRAARLVDVEAGREVWRQRLARGIATQLRGNSSMAISYVKRPLTAQPYGGLIEPHETLVHSPRRVVVRDFQTNQNGDVFLLFTGGRSVGQDDLRAAELTDEYGTKYVAPSIGQDGLLSSGHMEFIATCLERGKENPADMVIHGYTFNNEALEGCWWVPIRPTENGKPHHFTVTLHQNMQYGKTTFHLSIEEPACAVVPEYMPYMARPLFDRWVVTHEEALTRADYYRGEGRDLPQALAWYQQAISIDKEEENQVGEHRWAEIEWFAIYQIQTQLGKPEEAKAALRNANRDAVYAGPFRDQIRAAMNKEGLNP